MYKFMDGMQRVDSFPVSYNISTQGHPLKLKSGRFRTHKRTCFTCHIVKLWNLMLRMWRWPPTWKTLIEEWINSWRMGLSMATKHD